MKPSALAALAIFFAALLVAGCGGGSSGGSNSTAPAGGGPAKSGNGDATGGGAAGETTGGPGKKATAPNAPAGSKVVACKEGAADAVGLRATAIACGPARAAMMSWLRAKACGPAAGASRASCSVGPYRCQATVVDRGAAVSCARPGADVSFVAKGRPLKKSGSG